MDGRVLIVDDDAAVLRAHARVLGRAGFLVESAADGEAALHLLKRATFDVVLTDIDMPGMNGIRLLEQVRAHDLDIPVVLLTGVPSTDTAIKAIERGALRYLLKPVQTSELTSVLGDAVRLHRLAIAKRQAIDLAGGVEKLVTDHAGLVASFERAVDSLYLAYQPIISWSKQSVFAYEVLLRSREPDLPHPTAMIEAAERLGKTQVLGRRIRERAIAPIARLAEEAYLFINLHPNDLLDEHLLASQGPLTELASRIVLEITERASLHGINDVRSRIATLRDHGFGIALDDLGAGYAGLTSFALLEPEIVKLDMALVRDLDRHATKQTLVRTMISMSKELGIEVIAEGIETTAERDELLRAGCDLMQGYLFGRPGEPFVVPRY